MVSVNSSRSGESAWKIGGNIAGTPVTPNDY